MTHRSKRGVLCLIGVVIQSDEVESRLHLIAASAEHVTSADALTTHLRHCPATRPALRSVVQSQAPPLREPRASQSQAVDTQDRGYDLHHFHGQVIEERRGRTTQDLLSAGHVVPLTSSLHRSTAAWGGPRGLWRPPGAGSRAGYERVDSRWQTSGSLASLSGCR
ncbi:hypothetical protein EYF80_048293 [Liparis tanakae]|uniref:Uncharacterized protein n=1 Tax=Liparis tanakae TaxID=230148 RepID=A0A4Z2FLA8_9TELE|nr:hypothetical protein EYF80_048293 [Liparis tanakae]